MPASGPSIIVESAVLSPRSESPNSMQHPTIAVPDASPNSPTHLAKFRHFHTRRDREGSICRRQPDCRDRSHATTIEVPVGTERDPRQSSISIGVTNKEVDFDYSGYKGRGRYAQVATE